MVLMAKKKKHVQPSQNNNYLLNVLKHFGFNEKVIPYLFHNPSAEDYGAILNFYKTLPKYCKDLLETILFPDSIKNINKGTIGFYRDNLEANLNNMLCIFNMYNEKINLFLEYKKQFEKAFLLGNYIDATKKLDDTVDHISYSNWYMYHSLLLKERMEGFEANFSLLKDFLERGPEHQLHAVFLFSFSRMAEDDINLRTYKKYIDDEIYDYYKITSHKIKTFIQSYIDPFEIYFTEDLNNIFLGEEYTTLIDKYITFRKILINLLLHNKVLGLKILSKLLKFIKDPQLEKIYFFMLDDLHRETSICEDFYKILDLYTQGEYSECIKLSDVYIKSNETSIDIIEIYLKSHINNYTIPDLIDSSDCMLNVILTNMYNVLKKNDSTLESLNNLQTIALALHNFDFSVQILYFVHKIKNSNLKESYNKIYQIYSPVITPKCIDEFHDTKVKSNILNTLLNIYQNKLTIKFFIKLLEYETNENVDFNELNIPQNRITLHQSKILLAKNDFNQVISSLTPILNNFQDNPHIYEESLERLYYAYSMNNDVISCISLYVDNFFSNKNMISNIDVQKQIEYIDGNKGYKNLTITIDLILFLHICKASSKTISLVYRLLIRSLKITKPSKLDINLGSIDKTIYFLRYVCTQDILSKDVMNYQSLKDVELERVSLCQRLLSLDKINSVSYDEEITKITQERNIKERMREVDSSKIYVDINGLLNYDLKDFDKTFLRFKKIKDLSEKSFEEFYLLVAEDSQSSFENKQNYRKKYLTHDDQLKKVFLEIFVEILDKYLFSNEHGLDAYISTRIRHGTITGQLRKTFSDLKLITTKNSDTEIYLDNSYWLQKLSILDHNEIDTFNKIMNAFSKRIDDYNQYIKNALIKISMEQDSEALFDFSTHSLVNNSIVSHYFYRKIKQIDNYEDFINACLKVIKTILDVNLESIKRYFDNTVKIEYLNILEDLEKNINVINHNGRYSSLLNDLRRARTEIQHNIDIVRSWFQNTKREDVNFVFIDVINTSREIIKKLFSSTILNINYDIKYNDVFIGKYFISFVDCFKIFFENIANYAQNQSNIQVDITISIEDCTDYIKCTITNDVMTDDEDELVLLDATISRKNLELQESTGNTLANREEGNKGLLKVNNIIKRQLTNQKNHLTFYRENEKVFIVMTIFKKGLIDVQHINS